EDELVPALPIGLRKRAHRDLGGHRLRRRRLNGDTHAETVVMGCDYAFTSANVEPSDQSALGRLARTALAREPRARGARDLRRDLRRRPCRGRRRSRPFCASVARPRPARTSRTPGSSPTCLRSDTSTRLATTLRTLRPSAHSPEPSFHPWR